MEWRADGIVLGTRKLGETGVILEVMTAAHGRHLGVVRGGRSRRMQPVLQPGNEVALVWRARISDQLGQFTVEPVRARAAALMESAHALYGVQHAAALLRLLPERDAHPRLHSALGVVLDHLNDPHVAGALLARFELAMLDELGFGLDLTACAATGATRDLIWVSPKSGRAVSREAGAPYAAKLLPLPEFLVARPGANRPPEADAADLRAAFRLTGFFLDRHVSAPEGAAFVTTRDSLLAALEKAAGAGVPQNDLPNDAGR